MTRAAVAVVVMLAACGCAATQSGGGGEPNTGQSVPQAQRVGTPFDSASRPSVLAAPTSTARDSALSALHARYRREFQRADSVFKAAHKTLVSAPSSGQASKPTVGVRTEATSAVQPRSGSADSVWLRFTAPRFGSWSCEPDTAAPLHDACDVAVLRLKGQPPFYRRGIEASVAGWDSVQAFGTPDTIWRRHLPPGSRDSVRVLAGQFVAVPFTAAGPTRCGWRIAIVP